MSDLKRCSRCGDRKPAERFPGNRKAVDGRSSWCRDCHRDLMRDRRRTEAGKAVVARYNARPDVRARQNELAARRRAAPQFRAKRAGYESSPVRRLKQARRAAARRLAAATDPVRGARLVALIVGYDRELARLAASAK